MGDRFGVSRIFERDGERLELLPMTPELFEAVQRWPKKVRLSEFDGKPCYGVTFEDEAGEAVALRLVMGTVEGDRKTALDTISLFRIMLAWVLMDLSKKACRGIVLPCPYVKLRSEGKYELGYALMIQSEGMPGEPDPVGAGNIEMWEESFGPGGSAVVCHVYRNINSVCTAFKQNGCVIPDIEPYYRSCFGGVILDYMLMDDRIFYLRRDSPEDDVFLSALLEAGCRKAYWMPSLPITTLPPSKATRIEP